MIYATVDALNDGPYFWKTLVSKWPVPFKISDSESAILWSKDEDVGIVVAKRQLNDGAVRWVVQVFEVEVDKTIEQSSNKLLLEALLDEDMGFIYGTSFGMALDEVAVAQALQLFFPLIQGQWSQSLKLPIVIEDEQHV